MADDFDVVVVGGGPGGYVAALRAAQLGLSAAVVERERVGGVCTNWGCIPSKALIRNAEVLDLIHRAAEFGIAVGSVEASYEAAVKRSRQVVDRLVKGIELLLKRASVELITDTAELRSPTKVHLRGAARDLMTRTIVVATGAHARLIPGIAADGASVITHHEALELRDAPASVVVVGGGPVGVEFAYLWAAYGAKVTIVEMLEHILPNEDAEVAAHLTKAFQRRGIDILTGTKVETITPASGKQPARVRVNGPAGAAELTGEKVLVGVGFVANVEGFGLETVGVEVERGFVRVDGQQRTNVAGVYAVGDVTGESLLAHVGFAQGKLAAETIAGLETRPLVYEDVPRCVYSQPQVAGLGLTEEQAHDRGLSFHAARFPLLGNGKALTLGKDEAEGFVKLIVDDERGAILGAHLVGPEVTELIGELSLAKTLEATPEELALTVHPHPTLSEIIAEVGLVAEGRALHI